MSDLIVFLECLSWETLENLADVIIIMVKGASTFNRALLQKDLTRTRNVVLRFVGARLEQFRLDLCQCLFWPCLVLFRRLFGVILGFVWRYFGALFGGISGLVWSYFGALLGAISGACLELFRFLVWI